MPDRPSVSDMLLRGLNFASGGQAVNTLLSYPTVVRQTGSWLPSRMTPQGDPVFEYRGDKARGNETTALAAGPLVMAGKDADTTALGHEGDHVTQQAALGGGFFPAQVLGNLAGLSYYENPFEARATRNEPDSPEKVQYMKDRERDLAKRGPVMRALLRGLGGG